MLLLYVDFYGFSWLLSLSINMLQHQ